VRVASVWDFLDLPLEKTGSRQRCSFELRKIEIETEIKELRIAD